MLWLATQFGRKQGNPSFPRLQYLGFWSLSSNRVCVCVCFQCSGKMRLAKQNQIRRSRAEEEEEEETLSLGACHQVREELAEDDLLLLRFQSTIIIHH